MSIFVGLSYVEVSSTVMLSNYIWYKNGSSQSFETGKHFILNWNPSTRAGCTSGQFVKRSGPRSNGNERGILHSLEL